MPTRKGFLQLVIRASGTYEDEDIISAVNWRSCRCTVAQGICFAKETGSRQFARLNSSGLYDPGDIAQDYCEATSQFKFVRLGPTRAKIVRLSDGDEIEFDSNTPFVQHDGRTVQMDIVQYLARQTATLKKPTAQGKPIFGLQNGEEVLYGGRKDMSDTKLDIVWAAIESKTDFLEDDEVTGATFSNSRKTLVLACDDFDDEEACDLTSPLLDETDPDNPITVKKCKHHVDWRILSGIIEADVLDKSVDVRDDLLHTRVCAEIKLTKVLP